MLKVLDGGQMLRVAAVLLAGAAAWGPRGCSAAPVERVVVVDASLSCDVSAAALADVATYPSSADRLRLVVFADGAIAAWDGAPRDPATWRESLPATGLPADLPRPPGTASDLTAAFDVAASLLAGAGAFEVLVVGDGTVTVSDDALAGAATRLRDAGCVSLAWRRVPRRPGTPHVREVAGPGRVRLGALVGIVVSGHASAGGARLELVRDGVVVDGRDVPAGEFRIAFADRPERVGTHTYRARLDGAVEERAAQAHVVVARPGRALLLTDRADAASAASALGVPADTAGLAPTDLDELLATHRVVVVDGAPSAGGARALEAWARRGGGLVLLGGPPSVVESGGTLADAAPLRARAPQEAGAFVYLAVDGSGSMAQPWPGGRGTRDDVVRAAVQGVLRALPADTEVALRRFDDRLRPEGAPPWIGRPAEPDVVARAVASWAAPGGGTVLAPVLAEAARLTSARGETRRRVVVFTDGRVADDPEALASAAGALRDGGTRLTLVVDAEEGRDALEDALGAVAADVLLVGDALSLTEALRTAATGDETETARDPGLRVTDAGRGVPGLRAPARAAEVARRWSAPDASVLVETGGAWPVAAVRRHGEGRVAALASRGTELAGLPDEPASRELLAALCAVVTPRVDGDVRVRREGDAIVVRATGTSPAFVELETEGAPRRVPLRRAGGDLLRAEVPGATGGLVRLLDRDGAEIVSSGLDRPGAPELVRSRRIDGERLAALAGGPVRLPGSSWRPWLAALSVLALLAAHVLAARRRSSPGVLLPI